MLDINYIRMTSFKLFPTESTKFFKVGNSIPCHTSMRLSFNSLWFLGCFFLSCRSTSFHKCSIGFKSGENENQWSRSSPFLFSQLATMVALCFGSLSCWKIQSWLMPNFSTDFRKLFSKISRYDPPVISPSIKIKLTHTWRWEATPALDITTTMFDSGYGALGSALLLRRTPHYDLSIRLEEVEFTLIWPKHLIPEA